MSQEITDVLQQTELPRKVTAVLGVQNEELQRSFRSFYLVAALSIFLGVERTVSSLVTFLLT